MGKKREVGLYVVAREAVDAAGSVGHRGGRGRCPWGGISSDLRLREHAEPEQHSVGVLDHLDNGRAGVTWCALIASEARVYERCACFCLCRE